MKSTIYLGVVLFAVALISPAAAISNCAQMCIKNMLALASSLGCNPTDASCLCKNKDFGYGINDCTNEACGSADVPDVQSYGASMCANLGASQAPSGSAATTTASVKATAGTTAGTTGSASNTAGASATASSGATKPTTGSTGSAASSGSSATVTGSSSGTNPLVPYTTEAKLSTLVSGSVTSVESLGSTTLYTTAPPSKGATNGTTSGASGSGTSGSGASGSGAESTGPSTARSSSSSAAAHPLATVASGAAGVLGLAALFVL